MRPQRCPNPEVSVPATGQTIPDAEGAPVATDPDYELFYHYVYQPVEAAR
jgi:hypothetical protein